MRTTAFVTSFVVLLLGCASAPSSGRAPVTVDAVPRPSSAAPPEGAQCGPSRCGANQVCVPQGFCSGIRPSEPHERGIVYECVPVAPSCAEDPGCGCVGDPCRHGSCRSVSEGVVSCICA